VFPALMVEGVPVQQLAGGHTHTGKNILLFLQGGSSLFS
jgi:hypothetical protein